VRLEEDLVEAGLGGPAQQGGREQIAHQHLHRLRARLVPLGPRLARQRRHHAGCAERMDDLGARVGGEQPEAVEPGGEIRVVEQALVAGTPAQRLAGGLARH
jgi:hypothetical protein